MGTRKGEGPGMRSSSLPNCSFSVTFFYCFQRSIPNPLRQELKTGLIREWPNLFFRDKSVLGTLTVVRGCGRERGWYLIFDVHTFTELESRESCRRGVRVPVKRA